MCRIPRSRWCSQAFLALLVCGPSATADAQVAQPTLPAARIALTYDDQRIGDAERARLFSLIAESVPVNQWRSVEVKQPTDLRTIIDDYFDYYSSGPYQAPLTVEAVIETIRQKNDLQGRSVPAGRTILIPPLPMRANGDYRFAPQLRVFNADTQGYAAGQEGDVVQLPTTRELQLPSSNVRVAPLRAASGTSILVRVTSDNEARLMPREIPAGVSAASALPGVPRPDGSPRVVIGRVTIEFLSAQQVPCPNPLVMLERSPFRELQKARVQRAIANHLPALLKSAERTPLVILDVGFKSHHGSKVKKVAALVLGALGASEFAQKIVSVEMYPVDEAAQSELSSTFETYVKAEPPLTTSSQQYMLEVQEARKWITDSAGTAALTGPRLDVPELIVKALLAKHVRQPAVLNMSFRMQAPATAQLLKQFSEEGRSFNVSGVGNVVGPISEGWTPQDASAIRANFVNVSYGTEQGENLAEYENDERGVRVPLLAPGCGFDGITDSGSSLASPYVAAASWLKTLLDEVEQNRRLDTKELLRDLLSATRPIQALKHPIESGGMFDAAMLLAPPASEHFLLPHSQPAAPISELEMFAFCEQPSGPVFFSGLSPDAADVHTTFAVVETADGVYLWRRKIPRKFGKGHSKTVCKLKDFSFSAVLSTGKQIQFPQGTMSKFAKEIALFSW